MTLARALAVVFLAVVAAGPVAPARASGGWPWPVDGRVITAFSNGPDPYAGGQHRGIDIAARPGSPVRAAAAGTVRFAGVAGSSGLAIAIRTADGALDTSYLHLAAAHVREGDRVRAGDRVGAVGTSGRRSAPEPHLHFGVRTAGSRHDYRDPLDFLAPPVPRSAPRGAPAPVGAPVRARPLREPVRGRRRAPARRRVRTPARRPVRVPAGRRLPVPAARPSPLAQRRRTPLPVSRPAPAGGPAPAPGLGPSRAPAEAPDPRGAPAPGREAVPTGGAAGGPDLGWALACLGLLAAAACLGQPGRGQSPRKRRPPAARLTARLGRAEGRQ